MQLRAAAKGHPKCDACGILCCGNDYYDPMSEFRDYQVCRICKKHWLYLEKERGQKMSFARFRGVKANGDKLGRPVGSKDKRKSGSKCKNDL